MKKELKILIEKAILELYGADFSVPKIVVDYPTDEKFGDYSTNVAMVLARVLKKSPMEIAQDIADEIKKCHSELACPKSQHRCRRVEESNQNKKLDPSAPLRSSRDDRTVFGKIEVVEPGYINFYLAPEYLQDKVAEISKEGEKFGNADLEKDKKINIEFVSSNPTGPIHLGNARGGPIGDVLANVLEKAGYAVVREFYVNDYGHQVEILGHSILGDQEAQYKGDYINELSEQADKNITDPMATGYWAANVILEKFIKPTCDKSGIKFDNWFSEKSLHDSGAVDAIINLLKEKKLAHEKDGALWLKSTQFGDDKDRVLIKSDGKKTYIATDLAYHQNKIKRGFDKIINIQGADHHKESEVVKYFIADFLGEKNKFFPILTQFVRVMKDGAEVKMSKRKGIYFALDDLIEEVGRDATRFIFTSYSPTSHINFDINLAKERSEKNPVYYVQYAHARICSILSKVKSESEKEKVKSDADLSLLVHEKELGLIREMNKFPEMLEEISESYEVHRLPHYAIKLADKFHSFYSEVRVIDDNNSELSRARLSLVNAVRIVLSETLRLIGVEAPNKM